MTGTPSDRFDIPPPFTVGVRHSSRNQSRTKAGWLAGITEEVLADTAKLMAMFLTAADLPVDNFALQRQVLALAVHVMTSTGVRNPVGTFIAKMRLRDWSTINHADEVEAARQHRAWLGIREPRRRSENEPTSEPIPIGDTIRQLIEQRFH